MNSQQAFLGPVVVEDTCQLAIAIGLAHIHTYIHLIDECGSEEESCFGRGCQELVGSHTHIETPRTTRLVNMNETGSLVTTEAEATAAKDCLLLNRLVIYIFRLANACIS